MHELHEDRMQLKLIRDRYLLETEASPEGYLRHLRHCRHFAHMHEEPFYCSCGLIHDLTELSSTLREMLWSDYEKEVWCQFRQEWVEGEFPPPEVKEEWHKSEAILVEVFGAMQDTDEEIHERHNAEKKLIQEVFGQEFLDKLSTEKVLKDDLEAKHRLQSLERQLKAAKAAASLSGDPPQSP
jgi:hypothetical protein